MPPPPWCRALSRPEEVSCDSDKSYAVVLLCHLRSPCLVPFGPSSCGEKFRLGKFIQQCWQKDSSSSIADSGRVCGLRSRRCLRALPGLPRVRRGRAGEDCGGNSLPCVSLVPTSGSLQAVDSGGSKYWAGYGCSFQSCLNNPGSLACR